VGPYVIRFQRVHLVMMHSCVGVERNHGAFTLRTTVVLRTGALICVFRWGCGKHIDSVMSKIPEDEQCKCENSHPARPTNARPPYFLSCVFTHGISQAPPHAQDTHYKLEEETDLK
jgi:hypothetical protein